MLPTKKDSSLYEVMMSGSSLALVRLLQERTVEQEFSLNEAHIILGYIFSKGTKTEKHSYSSYDSIDGVFPSI